MLWRMVAVVASATVTACSMPACGGGGESAPPPATQTEPVAEAEAEPAPAEGGEEELPTGVAPPPPTDDELLDFTSVEPAPGPQGRAIAELAPRACLRRLRALRIPHERSDDPKAREAVDAPVVPTGPVGGVTLEFEGRRSIHRVMDCRLLLAIHAWTPVLRAAGVNRLRHLSALRPGARVRTTGQASGHSRGLAFDPRFFERDEGEPLDVLEDWQPRDRGAPVCPEGSAGGEDPPAGQEDVWERGAVLRALVCEAMRRDLFQVVVTPHHNDAHANHVHVEVVPGVDWTWSG